MTIRILEDRVVNRIAAGEVVERPASVVKELMENALDAEPTDLRVELEAGGKRLIRIVDDGFGMARQDALLCIERHATSKIRSDEDLLHIATMGFRGEALPSIASVSRFQLVTRRTEDPEGTRLVVDGGKLVAVEKTGCAPGTEVTVRDLFFNVPARRGFLRTTQTEYGHCLEAVIRVAMVHPDIDVSVVHNGREALRAPAGETPARRVAALLGPYGEALKPVSFTRGDIEVTGLVSPVGVHRQTAASGIYLYVNGRFVRDSVLRRAVLDAYKGLVPIGRYPVVVLQLRMQPALVDVNVHPSKVEVRFRSPRDVRATISQGLREGLREHGLFAASMQPRREPANTAPPPPIRQAALPLTSPLSFTPRSSTRPAAPSPLPPDLDSWQPPPPTSAEPPPPISTNTNTNTSTSTSTSTSTPEDLGIHPLLPVARFSDLHVIGQLAQTYILCEGAGELVVIDQHAAHERITLERLERIHERSKPVAQTLLTPIRTQLAPGRGAALAPHLALLRSIGLDIEAEADDRFAVRAIPPALGNIDIARLVRDVADDLADEGSGRPAQALVGHVLATLACHSSVRANQSLGIYEMRAMLASLDRVDFSVCAHGRPVAIRIASGELERRFHRS